MTDNIWRGSFHYELLSVKEGVKPLMKEIINIKEYQNIKKKCSNLELKIKHSKHKYLEINEGFKWVPFNDKQTNQIAVYISKSQELIEKISKLEENINLDYNEKIGILLGYPSCCIRFYMNLLRKGETPTPLQTFKNTTNEFSFFTNNIFLETKLKGPHLIFHIPCSHSCKKSIKFGKNILNIIEKQDHLEARRVRKFLKLPILYFNNNKLIAFKGLYKYNQIIYNKVYVPPASNNKTFNLLNKFKDGNKIKMNVENILIYRDDLIHYSIRRRHSLPLLFLFK